MDRTVKMPSNKEMRQLNKALHEAEIKNRDQLPLELQV
jgi:hypothetical protein